MSRVSLGKLILQFFLLRENIKENEEDEIDKNIDEISCLCNEFKSLRVKNNLENDSSKNLLKTVQSIKDNSFNFSGLEVHCDKISLRKQRESNERLIEQIDPDFQNKISKLCEEFDISLNEISFTYFNSIISRNQERYDAVKRKLDELCMCYVYILKLKKSKYYVGITNDIIRRYSQHLSGSSEYTKMYKVKKIICNFLCIKLFPYMILENPDIIPTKNTCERLVTLIVMGKYGLENVQGAQYTGSRHSICNTEMIRQMESKLSKSSEILYSELLQLGS